MLSKNYTPFVRAILHLVAILALLAGVTATTSTAYAAAPSNDDFSTPKNMSANTTVSIGDINTATSDGTDPSNSCTGDAGEVSVWYTFTPTASGEVTLGTANSGYDTVLVLWRDDPSLPGDPSALIEALCNDNAPGKLTSSLTLPLRGGVKYYIEVVRTTGAASSVPDPLKFSLTYSAKPVALPNWSSIQPYDDTSAAFTYSSTGWTTPAPNSLPTWNNTLHLSHNPGNTATVFFDGEQVALEFVTGPIYGNADAFIDGVFVGTLGQNSIGYLSTKQGTVALWYSPLLSDTVHKFVLRNANASLKINVDGIWVAPHVDTFPPDPITDLTATTGTTTGKVNLSWTAPGDDGMVGRVHHYEVRYSPDPITGLADWDIATPLAIGLPIPLSGGSTQSMIVQGLVPGLTYCFMVVGVDEAGNMGDPDFSNTDCGVANAPAPVGTGVYDDKFAGWLYEGVWNIVSKPTAYLNYYHTTGKVGRSATFYFTGTQFRLYYFSEFNMGLLDVFIDGVYIDTIDQYSPWSLKRTYVSPILGGGVPGPHAVQFVMSGLPYVNIDAIAINSTTDGGAPDPIIDLIATPGLNEGEVDLAWTATGDDPGGIDTASKYEVRFSIAPITTDLEWFGATLVSASIPVPSSAGGLESLTVAGLTPGVNYYFAVRALDDAGYSVLSNTDDAVAFNAAGYAVAGLYEDSDIFGSGGFWRFYTWVGGTFLPASNGDMHVTQTSGASAIFTFNGSGFTLYYQKGYKYGTLKVYVDEVLVGSISQKSLTTKWQQQWTWLGAAGDHTVRFVKSGGVKTTIDAILILP